MTQATICILITIFLYLLGMLAIGFYCAKKTSSTSDFFLGGRKLGPFVTAMSAEAVSYTHLDVYKRQRQKNLWSRSSACLWIFGFRFFWIPM